MLLVAALQSPLDPVGEGSRCDRHEQEQRNQIADPCSIGSEDAPGVKVGDNNVEARRARPDVGPVGVGTAPLRKTATGKGMTPHASS